MALLLLLAGTTAAQAVTTERAPGLYRLVEDAGVAVEPQRLVLPERATGPIHVPVVLGAKVEMLILWPHSVRAKGYQLIVQRNDGSLAVVPAPAPTTVRGTIEGRPGSLVAGSLRRGRLTAVVLPSMDEPPWSIRPVGEGAEHVLVPGLGPGFGPGLQRFLSGPIPGPSGSIAKGDLSILGGENGALMVAEIACDADVEYFQELGGSVTAVEDDVSGILNAVSAIYEDQVGIAYEITAIVVRTAEPDPYSSTDAMTLLNQVTSYWASPPSPVRRDVLQLFTGKNLSGGVLGAAFLDSICDLAHGASLVRSRFLSVIALRVKLSAKELGHNWGAGSCFNEPDCGIMGPLIGGSNTTFGSTAKSAILETKASADCLDPAP